MAWNPSLNGLTGPDSAFLRQLLSELKQFLAEPTFEKGIHLGDGRAVYNPTTGLASQVKTDLLRRQIVQTISTSTDASGFVTFNHGAASVPRLVVVQHQAPLQGPTVWVAGVDSYTATTARARFLTSNSGAVAAHVSAAVTFRVLTVV